MAEEQTIEGAIEPDESVEVSVEDANLSFDAGAAGEGAPEPTAEEKAATEAAATAKTDADAALELAKEAGMDPADLEGKTADEITAAIEAKGPAETDEEKAARETKEAEAKKLTDAEATAAVAAKAVADSKAADEAKIAQDAAKVVAADAADPVKVQDRLQASFIENMGDVKVADVDEAGNEIEITAKEFAERYPGTFKMASLLAQHISTDRATSIVDERTGPIQSTLEDQQFASKQADVFKVLAGDEFGHKDAAEIHGSEEFKEYYENAPPGIQALNDSWDPKDLAAGLTIYKSANGIETPSSDEAMTEATAAATKAGLEEADIADKTVAEIKALTATKVKATQAAAKKAADDIHRNTIRGRPHPAPGAPAEQPDDTEAADIFAKESKREE